jgi:hypothetical protein
MFRKLGLVGRVGRGLELFKPNRFLRMASFVVSSICLYMPDVILAQETTSFQYDALGRVIATSNSGGPRPTEQIVTTYDAAGNRTNHQVAGVPLPPILDIGNASAIEGASLIFTVTRSGATNAVTVNYATASGSATSGADFTALSGALSFAAGDLAKTITVATSDDVAVESTENMTVNLSGATGGAIVTTASGVGNISDNDSAISAAFSINDVSVGESGGSLVFTITKSGSTTVSHSVNYATASGAAATGADFTGVSGTLTFPFNVISQTVSVPILEDTLTEANETFSFNLSSATGGATISDSQGIGTITDNDQIIAITNNILGVLPTHEATYFCEIFDIPELSTYSETCTLGLFGTTVMQFNGTDALNGSVQLDPGYSRPVASRLEVIQSNYGTGVAP